MGKIKVPSLFRRSSSSKSPPQPPPPQAERTSGSPAPTAEEEFPKFDANRDGGILRPGLAALFEGLVHAATDDEVSRMMPEAADGDGDGDAFTSLQVEEEDELPWRDGEEETHGVGAEGGITVRSGAATTATVARRVTISGDRVVVTIDDEVETITGAGGITTADGARRVGVMDVVSAVEDNNEEEEDTKTLLWMVGILGGLSDSAAAGAAMYRSPRGVAAHGGDVAYRIVIASVFVASVVQMLAACLVRRGTGTREARAILYVSIFTLMVSITLGGVAIVLNM